MLLAPNWFVEEYHSNVKHIFQPKGFKPYFGTIDLQEKTRNSETPPSNPDQGMLSADLKDYDALYEIHEHDLEKMTANEKAAAHEAGGKGVGRKSDSIIMNAANDACIAAGDGTQGNGAGYWDLIEAQYAIDALQDADEIDEDSEITAVNMADSSVLADARLNNSTAAWSASRIDRPADDRTSPHRACSGRPCEDAAGVPANRAGIRSRESDGLATMPALTRIGVPRRVLPDCAAGWSGTPCGRCRTSGDGA